MNAFTHTNRQSVADLATEHKAKTIIEVGVRRGRLSVLLYEVPTLEHLYLIDIWLPEKATSQDQAKNLRSVRRWAKDKIDEVTILHMPSAKAVNYFQDNSIDFIYIDGDHSLRGVTQDIKNYYPKVRPGGILCGDDYDISSVQQAVDKHLPSRGFIADTRVWLVKKAVV